MVGADITIRTNWWNNNDKYDVVRLIDNYVIKYLISKFVCMKEYMLKEISC